MAKQTIEYKVGIYLRLSQEDMRSGESLSIEHQREIVTKFVSEQGWTSTQMTAAQGLTSQDRMCKDFLTMHRSERSM